jgi:hypothetical protein
MSANACIADLRQLGLLMKTDVLFPSVTTIVAGEPVKGSWWAHPLAHTIFVELRSLEAHPDVLLLKLVGGKDTFVHRRYWPEIAAIAMAREPWQTRRLSDAAAALAKEVKTAGSLETEGPDARLLESRLLVHGIQVHSQEGRHPKRLESWTHWAERVGQPLDELPSARKAMHTLEEIWLDADWPWTTG